MKKIKGMTMKVATMLLSGMLVVGSVPGAAFAAEIEVDPEQSSEIIVEDMGELSSENDLSEEPIEEVSEDVAAPEEAVTSYTVILDANGGYFENEWDDVLGDYVEQVEVVTNYIPIGGTVNVVPVNDQKDGVATFLGWSLERDGELVWQKKDTAEQVQGETAEIQAQDGYVPVESCVLYAVWKYEETITEIAPDGDSDFSESVSNPAEDEVNSEGGGQAENSDQIPNVDNEDKSTVDDNRELEAVDIGESGEGAEAVIEDRNEGVQENDSTDVFEEVLIPESDASEGSSKQEPKDDSPNLSYNGDQEKVSFDPLMGLGRSGTCGDNVTWTFDSNGTLTISGTGELTGNGVSSPWDNDRMFPNSVKHVVVNEGISGLGKRVFSGCASMESISLPESITYIGEYAFGSCYSLTSIDIPNNTSSIKKCAFFNCSHLYSVDIPKSVTTIEESAFAYCSKLNSVDIPESITEIESGLFHDCSNLESISIPDSATIIKNGVFDGCSNLSNITIPASVTEIESRAFSGCVNLKQIDIPKSVTRIGESAFSGAGLTKISIPNGLTSIEGALLSGCSSLVSVYIPDSVTSIGNCAFSYCRSLESIDIPEGVNNLGNEVFLNCSSLKNVYLPNGITKIPKWTFARCDSLEDVYFSGIINSIGDHAFFNCKSLTSIRIPADVGSIEKYAFLSCDNLKKIYFLGKRPSIGTDAFKGIIADGYHPANDDSWKNVSNSFYGGTINWGISTLTVELLDEQKEWSYTGNNICPLPLVKNSEGKELGKGTDYTLSYTNNIEPGTATITATGLGDYAGQMASVTFEIIDTIIKLEPVYTGVINEKVVINAEIISIIANPDSSNVTWTLTSLDGGDDSISWGSSQVHTIENNKYTVSKSVTITESGSYRLKVSFNNVTAESTVKVLGNGILPEFNLSTDTISYMNGSLGEELQLTLKAKNVLSDAEIDSLSQDQKDALCFHVDSIDFKIEGTPVAYFSQVGDEYTQEYSIVLLDGGLDIPIGEEKQLADFEILTNPPIAITVPTHVAEIIYTIKGSVDGKKTELSDKKTVKFLYDMKEEDAKPDHTNLVEEWVSNEGTLTSIKYLTNSSNFIHYIFVTEKDSGFGGKVTKGVSDLFYRGTDGRLELGTDKLTEQEAEQILVDFLNDIEEEVLSLATIGECAELGDSIAEGFKEYTATISIKTKEDVGIDISDLDEKFYQELGKELSEQLLRGDDINPGSLKVLAKQNNDAWTDLYNEYLKSVLYAEKVSQILGDIGKGVKFLSVSYETLKQMEEIWTLQIANDTYIDMLDYIADNCTYAPVKSAAKKLSGVISKEKEAVIEYAAESLISVGLETVEDKVVDVAPKLVSHFTKTKNALSLYAISAKVGFESGVLLSNTVLHTKENQELKDRMRILTAIGDTLGNWIYDGLNEYPTAKGLEKHSLAERIVYGQYMLIKARYLGEISYQKLCENVYADSCDGYRASMCIARTLQSFEELMTDTKYGNGVLYWVSTAGVYCPVDLDVCNENGDTLLTIEDGTEISGVTEDIHYWCIYNTIDDDYMKIVTYPSDKKYTLRCNGKGDGEVSAYFQDYDNDGCSHCITFEDIPVEKNTVITMDSVSVSSEQFKVKSNGIEEYCTYEKTKKEEEEHSFTSWQILRESTCSSYGLKKRSCTNCSKTELVELPLLKHNWNLEYTIDIVPTSNTPGQKSIHCRNCGTIKEDSVTEIPVLDAELISTGVCGDQINWALYDNGDLMISGTGIMSDWNNSNNFSPWHDHAADVKRVMLSSGIESIGNFAFYDCTNLKEVLIPDSISYVGRAAFRYCESLEEVVLPECVKKLETEIFCRCSNLKKVHLSRTLTSIDQYAFSYCSSLNEITIPETVESLGQGAFQYCTALTGISLPDGIRTISNSCFYQCSSLKKLVLPARVEAIEDYAINQCFNLTEIVIPESVNTVGKFALAGSAFKRIVLPEHLESLGNGAFYTCQNLEEIEIPAKITELGKGMFYGCDKLAKVILSDNIKSIESDAFTKCNNITIYGLDGSYAQTYAKKQNIPFISHNGHNYGEWEVIKSATLEEFGLQSHTCKICGMEETQTIPKLEIVSINDAVVTGVDNMLYTGKSLTQMLVVEIGSITLKANIDYTVTYKNNTNVGTAAVTITGKGNYTGTKTATFKINAAPLSRASITGLSAKTYTGKALTQSPVVKVGATTLKANADYTVAYKNNTNAGTATVTITGKGNYTGTKTATFKINKAAQSITAKSNASSIAVGKTATVSITGNKGTKSYKSSNTAIATVTSAGKVTAKKVGTVKITATSAATSNYNAASKAVTIKVVPAATASITAVNQATGIKITWKKVPGATGYKVYRGSTLIKTIKSGSTVTCTDTKANTNGTKYTFKIVPTVSTGNGTAKSLAVYRVARPAIKTAKNSAEKKMTVSWGRNAKATGYQIQYSPSKTFASGNKTATVTSAATVSKVIGSLAKGKTYYVRIRTYKTVGKTKYYSAWSAAKAVKITK